MKKGSGLFEDEPEGLEGLEHEECDYSPTTPEEMEDEMERRFHQLKAVSEKGAEEMEEEVAETDPDQDVEQEDLKGKGKIPQRVRPDQPFALQNPHAPWPVVVPYGVPLHPDEPHSAGLVYLEDAERGREVFEREARRQHTEAEWKALPPWKRQHIIEWRKARGKGRKGKGIGGKYEGGKEQRRPEGGGPDSEGPSGGTGNLVRDQGQEWDLVDQEQRTDDGTEDAAQGSRTEGELPEFPVQGYPEGYLLQDGRPFPRVPPLPPPIGHIEGVAPLPQGDLQPGLTPTGTYGLPNWRLRRARLHTQEARRDRFLRFLGHRHRAQQRRLQARRQQ